MTPATPLSKEERQRGYQIKYLANIGKKKCGCGAAAIRRSRGSPVCADCLRIEEWLAKREAAPPREIGIPEYAIHL